VLLLNSFLFLFHTCYYCEPFLCSAVLILNANLALKLVIIAAYYNTVSQGKIFADMSSICYAAMEVERIDRPISPDDGGRKYLRNVDKLIPDYTAQLPRRQSIFFSPP
jgi:hypothetical protein